MVRSPKTVAAAFEVGINFFFITADMHWPLYEATRRGLQKLLATGQHVRQQIVVAVVSYPTQPEFCTAPFHEMLAAMPALRSIDVAVIGGAYASDFVTRLEVYTEHKQTRLAGITAIGATFHDRVAARSALTHQSVEIAFARYNPAHAGARHDLFPHRPRSTSTLLFNFNSTDGFVSNDRMGALGLGSDSWRPAITDYYRFALTRPEVDGLLCALSEPREVSALARALDVGPLDEEEEHYLINLSTLADGHVAFEPDRS